MIWFPPDLKKAGLLWYHHIIIRTQCECTYTIWVHTHKVVMYISCSVDPCCSQAWMKHLYRRPYLHRKRTSQLNLVEEITAFVSCFSTAIATSFSDVWLFDTALQKQELVFRGHGRISSKAESWEWGNTSWEITEKHFQETEVLIVWEDVNNWQLNYSVRKCNI